ncbi:AraC family transcriptional regulator [Marinomonas ushuaiensis DSM 15871]|uniref:AraC family transcriptional regulator n=1 Tax=Marinomonas ushuaiensis DSM 15871 TaxID=1122207 RepID=X7EB61_9GAMM|nr:helix-turn-helix domain-containing protein [Marinomonas ushuaiensis]ETX12416.1 AraC family transcriptional regulator [Marinomonas ushuaiensis DSM 15871]
MSHSSLVNSLAGIRSKQPWLVMNAAEKFSLSGSDNPIISHFYSFEAKDAREATFAIPDGCVDILFDCDSDRPTAEVFGTPMAAMNMELNSQHRYFGVRFLSGIIPDCFNVSAEELIDHHYSFLDVVPQSNQVFEAIVTSSNFTEQAALFGDFFESKETRKPSDLTTQVLQSICQSNGTIRINDLEDLTGYSTRTVQRQFRADMGMTPKAFSQIIRCQSAVYDINHSEEVAFSDLACDLGFSDQAHFQREFKKLVHTTPLDYLHRVKHETYLERIRYL